MGGRHSKKVPGSVLEGFLGAFLHGVYHSPPTYMLSGYSFTVTEVKAESKYAFKVVAASTNFTGFISMFCHNAAVLRNVATF